MECEYQIKDDTVSVFRCKDYHSFWAEMKNHPDVKKMYLMSGTMPDCCAGKRLDAFLSENQTEFMTKVKERVQVPGEELKDRIEKEEGTSENCNFQRFPLLFFSAFQRDFRLPQVTCCTLTYKCFLPD